MNTWPRVLKIRCMPSSTSRPSRAKSRLRWSMVGRSIARSTRSGTLVGPGICRKCRPLRKAMSLTSLSFGDSIWTRNGDLRTFLQVGKNQETFSKSGAWRLREMGRLGEGSRHEPPGCLGDGARGCYHLRTKLLDPAQRYTHRGTRDRDRRAGPPEFIEDRRRDATQPDRVFFVVDRVSPRAGRGNHPVQGRRARDRVGRAPRKPTAQHFGDLALPPRGQKRLAHRRARQRRAATRARDRAHELAAFHLRQEHDVALAKEAKVDFLP